MAHISTSPESQVTDTHGDRKPPTGGELQQRNERIRSDHAAGASVVALSVQYFLSEKSIRRILQNT